MKFKKAFFGAFANNLFIVLGLAFCLSYLYYSQITFSYFMLFVGIIFGLELVPLNCVLGFAIGGKLANNVSRLENLDCIDFLKEKNIFREILREYSGATLYYLKDLKKGDEISAIVATLLNLKLKKKIDIINPKIIILDQDSIGLNYSEKYILEHIYNHKVLLDVFGYTFFYAEKEALEKGLIRIDEAQKKKIIKRSILFLGSILFLLAFLIGSHNHIVKLGVLIFFTYLLFFSISFLITYSWNVRNFYTRTEKGVEIASKVKGLYQFLNDFGNMKDKSEKELILWEEYLVYAVVLGINEPVVKELSSLICLNSENK